MSIFIFIILDMEADVKNNEDIRSTFNIVHHHAHVNYRNLVVSSASYQLWGRATQP